MRFIRGLHNLPMPFAGSVVTLGNFDGIHLGHQALLKQQIDLARQLHVPAVVISFEPQPREFFAGRQTVPRLMRVSEKYLALSRFGVDAFCCLYFDAELAALSAEAFVKQVLCRRFAMRGIVIGYDFRFGAKRQGDFALLQLLGEPCGFTVEQLGPVQINDEVVSSTRVRLALDKGDMHAARNLLGRYYSLRGKVTYGHQRGRDLGFPTANINLHRQLVPVSGVFVIRARLGAESFTGVANVGIRPTFQGNRVLLEVHLFDFDRTIYGANLEVEFLYRLRPEQRYDDFSELVAQIKRDVQQARDYLAGLRIA